MDLSKLTSKVIGDKRRWRQYKKRTTELPAPYRHAIDAVERYFMNFVPIDEERSVTMFEDLADLFEHAVADGTPVREIVGENPVEFVDAFVQNYTDGGYVAPRERKRLIEAIARAEEGGSANP